MRKNHTYESKLHMMMCGCRMRISRAEIMTGYDSFGCCA